MGRTVDFLCFCRTISCHANMSGHLRYRGSKGSDVCDLDGGGEDTSLLIISIFTRKKAPNNFVSYEAGARFVGNFSPISF